MREIKFRAWNDYTNEMRLDFAGFTNEFDVLNLTKFFNPENYLHLMQFTGVKDINNKEIYEGDIVRASYSIMSKEISTVEFRRGIFFVLKKGRYYPLSEFMYDSRDKTKDIEIVGNIYENPELLEQGRVVTQESEPMSLKKFPPNVKRI